MSKTVEDLLAEARATLASRLAPQEAARAQAGGAILIDIRGDDQIRTDGSIPGTLEIPRNVLEWRCDPTSQWRHPSIRNHAQLLVVICNEGCQSSLAAANLHQLGFASATDVDGGFVAWRASGLPIEASSASRHWDEIYSTRGLDQVSWHQPDPRVSLTLIDALNLPRDAAIIDVGGGTSTLAQHLVGNGFTDVTVLDASAAALAIATPPADQRAIQFVHHDLLTWVPDRPYDLWHDRALFHFFIEEPDRRRYLDLVTTALRPDGSVVIATFAEDGPEQCSGLPTMRYSSSQLASHFGDRFRVVGHEREEHRTPAGKVQPFTWLVLQRQS
jgi:rhodanese-related sulfurtransferase